MKLLLVEDDPQISKFAVREMTELGFEMSHCENGDDAYVEASRNEYDAIILDVMLPGGKSGLDVLRQLRADRNKVPVILLTARDELSDRLNGLKAGADDYLTKPFFVEELAARVEAVVRRVRGTNTTILRYQDLLVDTKNRDVRYGERQIFLTNREFDLLAYLMRSPSRVRTRAQIRDHVWDGQYDPSSNVVDVCVKRLRRKLTEEGEPDLIVSVRGVGYRMVTSEDG